MHDPRVADWAPHQALNFAWSPFKILSLPLLSLCLSLTQNKSPTYLKVHLEFMLFCFLLFVGFFFFWSFNWLGGQQMAPKFTNSWGPELILWAGWKMVRMSSQASSPMGKASYAHQPSFPFRHVYGGKSQLRGRLLFLHQGHLLTSLAEGLATNKMCRLYNPSTCVNLHPCLPWPRCHTWCVCKHFVLGLHVRVSR